MEEMQRNWVFTRVTGHNNLGEFDATVLGSLIPGIYRMYISRYIVARRARPQLYRFSTVRTVLASRVVRVTPDSSSLNLLN